VSVFGLVSIICYIKYILQQYPDLKYFFNFFPSPTPTISWTRKEGSLPSGRFEYGEYQTLFVIKDLHKDDEGTYVCIGSNSQGVVEVDIGLEVECKSKLFYRTVINIIITSHWTL
jgi:hypothetical protein